MYACPKFQLLCIASYFGTEIAPKNKNNEYFEKSNIKIVISI